VTHTNVTATATSIRLRNPSEIAKTTCIAFARSISSRVIDRQLRRRYRFLRRFSSDSGVRPDWRRRQRLTRELTVGTRSD
jgi:hypothetical protein